MRCCVPAITCRTARWRRKGPPAAARSTDCPTHRPEGYARQVEPSLRLPSQVGNIYTGSLYPGAAVLLHYEAAELAGARIGLFSWLGLRCRVLRRSRASRGRDLLTALDVTAPLRARHRLSVAEYEVLRRGDAQTDQRPAEDGSEHHSDAALTLPEKSPRYFGIDPERRRIYAVQ